MGLKQTLKTSVKKAFTTLKDLSVSVQFFQNAPGVYNPTTDTTADTNVQHNLTVIVVRPTEQELSFSPGLDLLTKKMLIAGQDVSFVPDTTDYVILEGSRHEIRRVNRVPGDSVYICFIQET